ncbi:MAG: tetrathionate reductase family octaheme c-type cytochrome [Ignavibacteriales bacterium]|nr:tetrathionate reductase family octaheme c-type cytochrome [Ignavibacteriales bacterium]MCB9219430.1 tetrathionate reductase family octaheme c-type cytochrome [Ignavibacteriales bacterium]MCB9259896.1 tetrathionate reductase family octaheme c-type cytochrome [Ignavibacteriales bacterium]
MKKLFIITTFFLFSIYNIAQEDHSELVEGPFSTPQEVTETCLMCHEGVEADIMKSRHWKWLGDEFENKHGEKVTFGKQNIINNFCIATSSNEPRCTSCHIGFGWKDGTFDFEDPNNIDCLVCHDQSGTYKKTPTGAGMPDESVDLVKVAQSVGPTKKANCGTCHFNGGGGTGVKHGDLDESLLNPSAELDIHMGGAGFECSECHAGENHQILGASHGSLIEGKNHIYCIDCHTEKPHEKKILNNHVASVACETCHIPTFAKEMATKTWWDWSTAGEDKTVEKDEFGMPKYDKKKGDFVWEMNVVPEYSWHNGKADYYQLGDKIDPNKVVKLNTLLGDIKDPNSKIAPFKVMRGKQIYDSGNNYLAVPKLFGPGGYWKTFDWNAAAKLGMESVNLPYSGQQAFVETEMYWPINHMVVSADEALSCTSCHGQKGTKRLDWEKLGYKGDPMKSGGRFE